jgi:hypothetical protein
MTDTDNNIKNNIFIEKAKKVHNNKYDYSKINYINCNQHIEIICPIHNSFLQRPVNHLKGYGCIICAKDTSIQKLSLTKEEFINKANKKFNNKFDYSNIEYNDYTKSVKIKCPIHDLFEYSPYEHLHSKYGCPNCGNMMSGNNRLKYKNIDDLINQFRNIHGNKYNYSNVVYTGVRNKIEILCDIHNKFYITTSSHLKGTGCPKCI